MHITGSTASGDFPTTTGAYDRTHGGGTCGAAPYTSTCFDGFAAKLNVAGDSLVYGTFVGGSDDERSFSLVVDASGAAHVAGFTYSADFPVTLGAYDTSHNGHADAFVLALNAAGSALTYSTFLGGTSNDRVTGIALSGSGTAYLTGYTHSPNFPTTAGAYDITCGTDGNCNDDGYPYSDAFVAKLNIAAAPNNPADLLYSTYLGGSDNDEGWAIAVDGSGAAYVAGGTASSNFPTTPGAYDTTYNGGDSEGSAGEAFVAKVNAAGTGLVYATFLGGSQNEEAYGITVDGSGVAYLTGFTDSPNFPTTAGAYDRTCGTDGNCNDSGDGFIAKLNAAGSGLIYSTFIGGSGDDTPVDIAIDSGGAAYVTGDTSSTDFPTTAGAYDRTHNGGYEDAFALKLSAAGSALAYSTLFGGDHYDRGRGIAVDGSGMAYVTGETRSTNFPTTAGAYDRTCGTDGNCGPPDEWGYYGYDAFVTKLNASGSGLAYSTFLGGSASDGGEGIALGGDGIAFVVGATAATDFPTTAGAYDRTYNGHWNDAFVTKVNASGSGLAYSTFIGGQGYDSGEDIAVDVSGAAYVTGYTDSSDFPTTAGAHDRTCGTDGTCNEVEYSLMLDAFVAKLNTAGSGLAYSTFLGGSSDENAYSLAIDSSGAAYVTGRTYSTDFPTSAGAYDTTCGTDGNCNYFEDDGFGVYIEDAFVAKLAIGGATPGTPTPTPTATRTPTRTATPTATATQPSGCVDDGYEDNDSCQDAAPIIPGTYPNLKICSGDDDWFSVNLAAGETVTITILFSNGQGDLDMALYDSDCATSRGAGATITDNERVVYTTPDGGIHSFKVYGFGGQSNSYDLIVESSATGCVDDGYEDNDTCQDAAPITPGTYPGLRVCSGDEDWFAVDLKAGDTITATILFSHELGDLDLFLHDKNCGGYLKYSNSSTDDESLSYTAAADGTYGIRIKGIPMTSLWKHLPPEQPRPPRRAHARPARHRPSHARQRARRRQQQPRRALAVAWMIGLRRTTRVGPPLPLSRQVTTPTSRYAPAIGTGSA
jgi:hypothetical protein